MNKEETNKNAHYGFLPSNAEGINSLAELALDLRWSWNHAADALWKQLDNELWELTHNPWIVLQTVSREKLESTLTDPSFQQKTGELLIAKEHANSKPGW